jgi:hypothetical protein
MDNIARHCPNRRMVPDSQYVKRLAKRILNIAALLLSAFVFLLAMSGLSIGRATGLRVLNYIPPNLTPPVEIVCVVVQENQASDLFELPN